MENTSRKHILFISRWYPHRYDPMFGLFVERHARAAAIHNDVSVIYVHADTSISKSFFEEHHEKHFREIKYYYPVKKGLGRLISPWHFFSVMKQAFKKLESFGRQPDVVHVNILTRMGAFAWWLKRTRDIPYVITEHWSRYQPQHNNFKGFFRKRLTKKVVKHAAAVSTVSDDLRQAMEFHGLANDNYKVIPNVVDVDFFHPDKAKEKSNKTIFIHLSCMEERSKNMSGILNAVKALTLKRDDFILYMVGEGVDLQQTIQKAEGLGLKDRVVFFTGLKEGDELLKLMQRADAMVLFSRYENLPVVILEAFACGMPVISSDVGGISEHLNNKRGRLVEPLNESALTDAMEKMIVEKDTFDREAIRQYATDHFSMEVIGNQFDKMYSEAISRR